MMVNFADGTDVIIQEKLNDYMPTPKCRYILHVARVKRFSV